MLSCGRELLGYLLSWAPPVVEASLSHNEDVSRPFDLRDVDRRRKLDFNSVKEDREESRLWFLFVGEGENEEGGSYSSVRMAVVGLLLLLSVRVSLWASSLCKDSGWDWGKAGALLVTLLRFRNREEPLRKASVMTRGLEQPEFGSWVCHTALASGKGVM